MPQYLRAYRQELEQDSGPLSFVASTPGIKRDGKDLDPGRWMLDNYRKNPVVLWAHDYRGQRPPIGWGRVEIQPGQLVASITFDQEDPFAREIERKYRSGFLNAVSVGWDDKQLEDGPAYELLDISAVPVPGDPDALMERSREGIRTLLAWHEQEYEGNTITLVEGWAGTTGTDNTTTTGDKNYHILSADPDVIERVKDRVASRRAAIPPHSTAKADEGTAWDASAQVKQIEGRAKLRMLHAWVKDGADPESKSSYKLPHHLASGQVVWRGVAAAMSRLLQAGTQIPDGDRRGVYRHLARHYGQFDKETPEFRTAEEIGAFGPDEIRGLFLEGEPDMWPGLFELEPMFVSDWTIRSLAPVTITGQELLRQAIHVLQGMLDQAEPEAEPESAVEPPHVSLETLRQIRDKLQEV